MKQSEVNDRFPIFRERFREVQGNMSDTEFGTFLGISRQTVGFYGNGQRVPDAVTLRDIAEKCGVSADYLLGLSDEKTNDKNKSDVCGYIGISGEAVDALSFLAKSDKDTLCAVLTSPRFAEMLRSIRDSVSFCKIRGDLIAFQVLSDMAGKNNEVVEVLKRLHKGNPDLAFKYAVTEEAGKLFDEVSADVYEIK